VSGDTRWRSHRFAPLTELTGTEAWQAGVPEHLSASMQAATADGFQRGMDRGYREGQDSGHRDGLAKGLAEGRAQGQREGTEKALQDARAQFETLARPIESLLAQLQGLQEDYQSALRKEVVDLVARVAREVIRCELVLQPGQLLTLVDETLATMPRASKRTTQIALNDKDLERIREIDPKRASRWNLVGDPHLESGECRIRTADREVDAGCRQRLAACLGQVNDQLLPDDDAVTEAAA
jgi:flagellar assembly protein FliH